MDLVALGAAASLLVAIAAFGRALSTGPAGAQARARLEMALSGATSSIIEGGAGDPRRARKRLGFLQYLVSGGWLQRTQRDLRLADSNLQPTDFLAIRAALALLAFVVLF